MDTAWVPRDIVSGREQGKGLVVFLKGITDREEARNLLGVEIAVDRAQLPPLPAGEFYWSDLLGMQVVDMQGRPLGKVADMQETGANDVMVVVGERKFLLPWVPEEIVKQVDIETGRVCVDWDPEYQ